MIHLYEKSRMTRWFVWCVDHCGELASTTHKDERGVEQVNTGAYYVAHGTNLCHIFWAAVWLPLMVLAIFAGFIALLFGMHVASHQAFVANLGVAAYFVPEMIAGGIFIVGAVTVFACIGGDKVGFWALLWQYLKGVKSKICPLVKFDKAQSD